MRYLYISFIFFFLSIKNIYALELSCLFEEVHQNGEVHQGVLIVKDKRFRYQYFSPNLYTIIHKKNLFFYLENRDKTKFFKISKNTDLLESIVDIINDIPDVKSVYHVRDSIIKVEYSNQEKTIKRVVVLSDQQNMSVYLNECIDKSIKDIYFSWSPFWDYKH
mgnify:CR=1 FL=1